MRVNEVTVSAGRTFSHPYEEYSNLRPGVTIRAVLDPEEDFVAVTRELQAKAEDLVERHKEAMLHSLRQIHTLSAAQRRLASLEREIAARHVEIEEVRRQTAEIEQGYLPDGTEPLDPSEVF